MSASLRPFPFRVAVSAIVVAVAAIVVAVIAVAIIVAVTTASCPLRTQSPKVGSALMELFRHQFTECSLQLLEDVPSGAPDEVMC